MKHIINIILIAFLSGCTLAEVNVEVVSERTALENQVLGTYNSLDREMLLTSSVRGVDAKGKIKTPPRTSQEQKDVISAMQLIDFHEDDIRKLKQMKWLGESNRGFLEILPHKAEDVPLPYIAFSKTYKDEEFKTMVENVNESRKIIMQRVIDMNENLSEKDMPEIQKVFGNLNSENAVSGETIQNQNGKWIVK